MKKALVRVLAILLVLTHITVVGVSAEEKCYSWSIARNGNKQPSFSKEQQAVEEYGGYFIDKKHTDDASEKVLYLTYDAGYENGNIEKILDVMKEKNVSSAFFILDRLIYKNPELVKRMKSEGHLVCNHTKKHKDLSLSTKEEVREELCALEQLCLERTGIDLDKFFRFPEGKYSLSAMKHVEELGYKTVFWSFAYEDWDNSNQPSEAAAMKKILSNTHNGAVVLLHPTADTNAAILSRLIDKWREDGYRFGSLYELVEQ